METVTLEVKQALLFPFFYSKTSIFYNVITKFSIQIKNDYSYFISNWESS